MHRKHTQMPTEMIGESFAGVQSSHEGLRCLKEKQYVILWARRKQYVQYHSQDVGSEHKTSLPAIPMSPPVLQDVTPSSLWEPPQKNSCKHPNPQGNVK